MPRHPEQSRWRWAWLCSWVLHALVIGLSIMWVRMEPKTAESSGNSTIVDEAEEMRMEWLVAKLEEPAGVTVSPPLADPVVEPEQPKPPELAPTPPEQPPKEAATAAPRKIQPMPIDPEPASVVVPVTEVTPIEFRQPERKPQVMQSPPSMPEVSGRETTLQKLSRVVHGQLPDKRRVVYVMDRSSSLGLIPEQFDRLRAAVLGTIASLPASQEFQVLAYHGEVRELLGDTRNKWLTANKEIRKKILAECLTLRPEGRSDHALALQAALQYEVDYVLIFSDASIEEMAKLQPILRGAQRPVVVYLVQVTSDTVFAPVPVPGR